MLYIGQLLYSETLKKVIVYAGIQETPPYETLATDGETWFNIPNVYDKKNFGLMDTLFKDNKPFIALGNIGFFGVLKESKPNLMKIKAYLNMFHKHYKVGEYKGTDNPKREITLRK